ncbi:winged helix-turn-helix domain-containing protein [Actinocrispum sp. NPDC049592]|uniref:ArsR/SmtB family transcription factor n=1 Tax=Actinocrispum sp. NPDC049592 TaxID=3154835 RepID=UPI0034271967
MRRLYFTGDDLARVRLLPTLGPLAEAMLSLLTLRGRVDDAMFGGWRRQVRAATGLRRDVLTAMSPGKDVWLDLISPSRPTLTVAHGRESLLAGRAGDFRFELDHYADACGGLPPVLAGLDDDLVARRLFVDGLVDYHDVAVGPRWSRIQAQLDADRLVRSQILLDRGVDGLFETLHPTVRWEPPVLTQTLCPAHHGDIYLDGRGIVLAPSFFKREPVLLVPGNPDEQHILVYPVPLTPGVWAEGEPARALANLLGRTRATVLRAISDGSATTTQLASRIGASAATVSQHTAVLREAGLITSHRYRNTVHHMLAAPGAVLLDSN